MPRVLDELSLRLIKSSAIRPCSPSQMDKSSRLNSISWSSRRGWIPSAMSWVSLIGQQLWNIPFETYLSYWLSPSPGAIEGLLWRLAGFGTMTLASE